MNIKFDPKTFDWTNVKLENAMQCQGCHKNMALLKNGQYQCPHCGGQSTAFGGFWTHEELTLAADSGKTTVK